MTTYTFYRHRTWPAFRLVLPSESGFPAETRAEDWEPTRERTEDDVSVDVLADIRDRGYALFMLEARFSQIPPG